MCKSPNILSQPTCNPANDFPNLQDHVPRAASVHGGPRLQPQVPGLRQEHHLQGRQHVFLLLIPLLLPGHRIRLDPGPCHGGPAVGSCGGFVEGALKDLLESEKSICDLSAAKFSGILFLPHVVSSCVISVNKYSLQ